MAVIARVLIGTFIIILSTLFYATLALSTAANNIGLSDIERGRS